MEAHDRSDEPLGGLVARLHLVLQAGEHRLDPVCVHERSVAVHELNRRAVQHLLRTNLREEGDKVFLEVVSVFVLVVAAILLLVGVIVLWHLDVLEVPNEAQLAEYVLEPKGFLD